MVAVAAVEEDDGEVDRPSAKAAALAMAVMINTLESRSRTSFTCEPRCAT